MASKKSTKRERMPRRDKKPLKARDRVKQASKSVKSVKAAEGKKAPAKSSKKAEKEEEASHEDPKEEAEASGDENDEGAPKNDEGAPKKKQKTKANRLAEALEEHSSEEEEDIPRGTVFVSRLPDGAYEPQLMTYFKQFGTITRFQFARSLKTGNPKGWAWIEYEDIEVAEIVVKTMNGYIIEGRQLFCRLMTSEEVGKWTFPEGLNAKTEAEILKIVPFGPIKRKADAKMKNDRPTVEVDGEALPVQTLSQIIRQDKALAKLDAKLKALGIDYDLSPFKLGQGAAYEAAFKERDDWWQACKAESSFKHVKANKAHKPVRKVNESLVIDDSEYVEVMADEDVAAEAKRKAKANKVQGAAVAAATTEAAQGDRGTVAKEEEEAAQEGEPTRKPKKKVSKAAKAKKPQPKKKRRPEE